MKRSKGCYVSLTSQDEKMRQNGYCKERLLTDDQILMTDNEKDE